MRNKAATQTAAHPKTPFYRLPNNDNVAYIDWQVIVDYLHERAY